MNLLLDTHVLLWWLIDEPTLSKKAAGAIEDGSNLVFVSAATLWEIEIKVSIGKLSILDDFTEILEEQAMEELPVTWKHAEATAKLPWHHRDPFDRMLVAQAKTEGLTVATRDTKLRKYRVPIISA